MKRLLTVGLALGGVVLAATAIGFATSAHRAQTELAQIRVGTTGGETGGAISVPLLKKLLAERETAYFALQNEYDRLKRGSSTNQPASKATTSGVATNTVAGRGRGESYLDRLRTEDPERYKQIQADREQRRQRAAEELTRQLTRLDERLQAATTQPEAELVTQIAETLAHMDDLRQQWQQVRDLPEDQRNAAMQQLRDDSSATYQKLADLRKQDQVLQLQQLGSQLGQNPATFAQRVQTIITETDTSPSRLFGSGRRSGNPSPPAP
jgi:hypothetical protein